MKKRVKLLDAYQELREAGSSSDFPNILGNVMYRRLLNWAQRIPDTWRQYSIQSDLADFRPQNALLGYEAEDLLPVGEEGVYQDSKLGDASYSVQLGTYGRTFSINRNVLINDDVNYIRRQPERFGRAAGRSIAKFVAQTLLEGNAQTFDGQPLFSAAHGNIQTGAGSAFGSTPIQNMITGLRAQTVLGVYYTANPRWLLIPPALEFAADQLLNSTVILAAGGDATAGAQPRLIPNANVLSNRLGLLVDPFLTSQTAYYVLVDPGEVPIIDVAFLNGKQTPDLLVERPVMQNLAGGDDEFEIEFDRLVYKVRFDYGGATALWWGGAKANGA
jgi:hypothetical protein